MAIFALSDLHLPLGNDKPMDVFGAGWDNYVGKIEYNWKKIVKDTDCVIINGDFSWAMYMEESLADFKFIDSLPGKKILTKGNHDYWWATITKLNKFKEKHNLESVFFIHNSAIKIDDVAISGTRGWICPSDKNFKKDDMKIYERELSRFETSVKEACGLADTVIAALHYPPDDAFVKIMADYNVSLCVFGHLHGRKAEEFKSPYKNCFLVSSDYLRFIPKRLF